MYKGFNNHKKPKPVGTIAAITADSRPDFDDWGRDTYWKADDWIKWYYALKSKYGTIGAKAIWISQIKRMDPFEAGQLFRYNTGYWKFLKRNGLQTAGSNTVTDLIMSTSQVVKFGWDILPIAAATLAGFYIYSKTKNNG